MFKATFAKSLFTILVVLGFTSMVNANEFYSKDSDFVIQYRACFSTQIGFDILQNSMDTLFTEYIDRFNSDATSSIRKINTHSNTRLDDKSYKVTRGEAIKLAINENSLDFSVDYTATSGDEKLEGQFRVSLDVEYPKEGGFHTMPQLKLRLDRSSQLATLIFTFEEGSHFDQPSATRMLTGFLRTLNEYTQKSAASSFFALNGEAMNLNIILNCNSKEVDTLKLQTIPSDTVEFGLSNNVMNMVYPYSYDFRLNTLVNRIMMFNPKMHALYEQYSLRQARGLLRLTYDDEILGKFKNKESYKAPKISTISQDDTGKKAKVGQQGDIMRFTSSSFLEFQDYTNATLYDIAVAPFDIIWDIKASIEDREDGSQKFNAEFVKSKFKFRKCEMVFNDLKGKTVPKALEKNEDEDFDDEDDENDDETEAEAIGFKSLMGIFDDDEGGKRTIQLSNYQNLACGAKGMIPQKIKDNKEKVQEMSKTIIDFIIDGFKHLNDIPEGESYQLQCAGLNLSRPKTRLESDRIVVSMKLKNNGNTIPSHLKDFCDKEDQELLRVDPRTFTFEQQQVIKQWVIYETHNQNFNYLFEIGKRSYVKNAKTFMDIMSPVAQSVSSHEFLQDYCREKHPKANAQRCAFVYTQAKAWEEFNQVLNATHLDVLDPRNAYDPMDIDVNSDAYVTVKGQIFTNFQHVISHHKEIQRSQKNKILQHQSGKKYQLVDCLYAEMIDKFNEVMQPFIDGIDEYCQDVTEVECNLRKTEITGLHADEEARKNQLQDQWDQEELRNFHFKACSTEGGDCNDPFDCKTKTYLEGDAKQQFIKKLDMGSDCPDKEFVETIRSINKKKLDEYTMHYESHYKRYRPDGSMLTEQPKIDVLRANIKKNEEESKERERLQQIENTKGQVAQLAKIKEAANKKQKERAQLKKQAREEAKKEEL